MAVKRAQEIDDLASKLQPPTLDPNILATLLQTCAIAFTSAVAIATSQAGPIVTSILAPPIKRAEGLLKQTCNLKPDFRAAAEWDKLWYRTPYLLTNKQQQWPTRKFHTISAIFTTVKKYKEWSGITGKYLMMKASSECEEFISKKTLHTIGIKDKDGIWKARHRLFATAHAHPTLNITGEPFLIESRSPLSSSITLFINNKITPAPVPTRQQPDQAVHTRARRLRRHPVQLRRLRARAAAPHAAVDGGPSPARRRAGADVRELLDISGAGDAPASAGPGPPWPTRNINPGPRQRRPRRSPPSSLSSEGKGRR